MSARYVVEVVCYGSIATLGKVLDKQENRYICSCGKVDDAQAIAKSMNVSNSWEPILMSSEEKANDY
jgi:hypothetical protein